MPSIPQKKEEKDSKGISAKKEENFSDWYSEVVLKAELADYAPIKGFMVIRPNAYAIWEKIQEYFNPIIKAKGISNSYFPFLIPDSFFKKEAEHAKGFAPELAYVQGTEEGERLALRPTSETIMYDSFSKWIRSWRDLPLQLNQWCNIIRCEVKQTKPFIRTREFLWQEGHCAFESEKEAIENMEDIITEYKTMIQELLAIPVLMGKKSIAEKFPGAKTTMTVEALMPDGKALQCGTSHNLGQGFAESFNVSFKGKDEKEHNCWQTSWGFSTRLIGALIMVHGDNKGLVLPPKIAEKKIALVPIIFEDSKDKVMKKAKEIARKLSKFGVILDDRESYSSGWKFNEWEMKGIPIRIEIGPRDLAKKQLTIIRRDNGKKETISEEKISDYSSNLLEKIQNDMYQKAEKFLKSNITDASSMNELKNKLKEGKIVKVYMKDSPFVEEKIKEATGAQSRIIEETDKKGKCIQSGEEVKTIAYIAKSY